VYDYIIVGAGSAGGVVAGHLSEDPSTRVLVLEGGPADDLPEIAMSATAPTLWSGPLTWDNVTVPQRHAARRALPWPSGRTLGGSSSINGMLYIRGNRLDYDGWRDAYGCSGWGYLDLLPYFRRAEDQQRGGSRYHGAGGPLRVEDQRYEHPLSRAWLEAAVASGLPRNRDFNGARQDGVGHYQMTQRAGRRWSVADAYLRPAMQRPNLTVETDAYVTQVIVDGDRATGVRYVRDGATREVAVTGEVVVACGAVKTPQLLLLSGIGPADQLGAHHIPVLVDLPAVGAGLQDHPMCLPGWRTPTTRNLWEEMTPEHLELWRRERRGPMASFGAEAVVAGQADGGQLGGVVGAQREQLAREGDGHDPVDHAFVQWAGRERSTKAKSPGWRRAWRPSWSTTTSPRATTSTLQRSASIIWMCRRRRSAPPGLDADRSPTRTTPRSVARTWSGGSLPPPDRTSSGPKAALTTSWTYSERAAAGTSSARSTTVMAIS